jgi:hypothetical protein
MKKIHSILILSALCSIQLFAQVVDKNGYIITLEDDTLYGKIEYSIIQRTKNVCHFTGDKGTVNYTPAGIKGFFYDRDKYYTSGVIENAFLQKLVTGELSLYKEGAVYYLEKKGNKPLKLIYTEKTDTIDGVISVREDLTWKGYVNIFIYDCIKDPAVLVRLNIYEPELTRLAINYNKCRGTGYTDYLSKKAWSRVELGITTGITRSSINIDKIAGSSDFLPDRYVSYDQSFGLAVVLSSPRFVKRIAIQSEVSFLKSDFFSEVIRTYPGVTNYYDTYVRLSTLSFPQSLRYTVADRNCRIYVNLGLLFANNLNCRTRLERELQQGDDVFFSSGEAFQTIVKQTGYWGGIGFQKSFSSISAGLSLRYDRLNMLLAGKHKSDISHLSLSLIISTK